MALISKPRDLSKSEIKIKILSTLKKEIIEYCQWAGFNDDIDHFMSEAAEYILAHDKKWHKEKKQTEKQPESEEEVIA